MSKTLLHVGCGPKKPELLPPEFRGQDWTEIRVDIDERVEPDHVADMTDLSMIEDGSIDAVYCAHAVEHLFDHQLPKAMAEFKRVLRPDGYAMITTPDLQAAITALGEGGDIEQTLYESPAGPITLLDIMYGYRPAIAAGATDMAHRTGFTQHRLGRVLVAGGFPSAQVTRKKEAFELVGFGYREGHPQAIEDAERLRQRRESAKETETSGASDA